jgi:hypothetical protein
VKASELTGRAREYFDDWRKLGLSESAALAEVERSGIVVEQQLAEAFEAHGLSPEAARTAAQGRDGGAVGGPFDELVSFYEARGLSPAAARAAAIGRDGTETEARQRFAEAAKPGPTDRARPHLSESQDRTQRVELREVQGWKPYTMGGK